MARPTKYKPEYCESIIKFFSIEPYREVAEIVKYKNGDERTEYKEVANDLPFLVDFAESIGVSTQTINSWTKKFPEFLDAYNRAKELQERFLAVNALRGNFEGYFSVFTAKNICGWRDKTEIGGANGGPLTIKLISYVGVQQGTIGALALSNGNGNHDPV